MERAEADEVGAGPLQREGGADHIHDITRGADLFQKLGEENAPCDAAGLGNSSTRIREAGPGDPGSTSGAPHRIAAVQGRQGSGRFGMGDGAWRCWNRRAATVAGPPFDPLAGETDRKPLFVRCRMVSIPARFVGWVAPVGRAAD